MTQFHEGQEVEVHNTAHPEVAWRKAKIGWREPEGSKWGNNSYTVKFPDGTGDVFDAAHIRALPSRTQFHEGQEIVEVQDELSV